MKKPNLQRLAQRSKIYLRKASPTILSGLGAAGVIVTSVLAVRATPKALRKIRADSKTNHDGDPEAYSKLEAVKSAWVCYIPAAISGTATIFCIFGTLEPLEGGDTVGWSIDTGIYWIDFNHSKVTLDDGLEVLVIDMDWVPDAGWDSE